MIYAYRTTNNINNKFYIGIHKSNTNIKDNYIGCGVRRQADARLNTRFHAAVRKYGYNNFISVIIKTFNNYADALLWENEYITDDMIQSDSCYNMKRGGKGGGYKWSEEKKQDVRDRGTYKKSSDTKFKLSIAAIERFKVEQGTFTGKTHTIETRELLSSVRKGRLSKNKGKKLNLTKEQKQQKRVQFLLNAHTAAIKANKLFSEEEEQQIIDEYTGVRGNKVYLANKYNCSISLITRLVGKSFEHNKQ
jgi:hypothetical protein